MANIFKLPSWAKDPQLDKAALEIFKESKKIGTITRVSKQCAVVFGRNKNITDVLLQHPSISRQHSVILHGKSGNMYIMDLGSSHGTFVNKKKLINDQREPLDEGDIIRFGASTREYHVKLCYERNSSTINHKRELGSIETREKQKKKKERIFENEDSVGCYHLLVKHKDSRRPTSWREKEITRTKDEALEIIRGFKKQIENAEFKKTKFEELVKEFSDCNSHNRGGDLGKFKRGKMQKPFEDCAFSLKIGELSEPVITASGIHLILRII